MLGTWLEAEFEVRAALDLKPAMSAPVKLGDPQTRGTLRTKHTSIKVKGQVYQRETEGEMVHFIVPVSQPVVKRYRDTESNEKAACAVASPAKE